MVSRLTARDVAELYVQDRQRQGLTVEVEAALTEFETDFLLNEESVRNPRIVLIAGEFPASVTASVVWLNERAVDLSLVRYRAYSLPSGHVIVTFSRFFPVPNVEEFTVGRLRATETTPAEATRAMPWDEVSLRRVAERGNVATLTLLDLCASSDGPVGVNDIQTHAGLTTGQVRGQLAGFTMLLRNKRNGFQQSASPVQITWLPGGVASYTMQPELKLIWQSVRGFTQATKPPSDRQGNEDTQSGEATPDEGSTG
jgi:hypothetical protein